VFFGGLPQRKTRRLYFWSLKLLHLISFSGKSAEKRKGNPDGPVLPIVTDDLSWGRIVGCFRERAMRLLKPPAVLPVMCQHNVAMRLTYEASR
jgi:hypothetical protein